MKIYFVVFLVQTILLLPSQNLFSQSLDSTTARPTAHRGRAVTVTNNGISLLPTFALGKPAAMFDMSVGKGKRSFEPQFHFSMEGKPDLLLQPRV